MYQRSYLIPPLELSEIHRDALQNNFNPRGTVRCQNVPMFRTPAARDLGCLLDVDPEVIEWTCLPLVLRHGLQEFVPDFSLTTATATRVVHSLPVPDWLPEAASDAGLSYQQDRYLLHDDTCRIANARDLLRYASYSVSLGDRVRLLALLNEYGSMSLTDCASVIRNSGDAIGAIASLALQRVVLMDLDDAPIGPDTRIHAA